MQFGGITIHLILSMALGLISLLHFVIVWIARGKLVGGTSGLATSAVLVTRVVGHVC
jgi:hypothetical protein